MAIAQGLLPSARRSACPCLDLPAPVPLRDVAENTRRAARPEEEASEKKIPLRPTVPERWNLRARHSHFPGWLRGDRDSRVLPSVPSTYRPPLRVRSMIGFWYCFVQLHQPADPEPPFALAAQFVRSPSQSIPLHRTADRKPRPPVRARKRNSCE